MLDGSRLLSYGNVHSSEFDGLLVDFRNIDKLYVKGKTLYLGCRFSKDLKVCEYDNDSEALEDLLVYKRVMKNPLVAVCLIDSRGMLSAYPKNSMEFFELSSSLDNFYGK